MAAPKAEPAAALSSGTGIMLARELHVTRKDLVALPHYTKKPQVSVWK